MLNNIFYYFGTTHRRKILDELLKKNTYYYQGIVLDIGGRDRGRFRKPKDRVKKWIFADAEGKNNPDIVLDVADMSNIEAKSIDVINAIELFEHVNNPRQGLKECYRVLKKNGTMLLSVPFLYPIHADPYDFQRWTEDRWKEELKTTGFKIEQFIIMGRYFTVLADTIKAFIQSIPRFLKLLLYLYHPILDLLVRLDSLKCVQNHPRLGKFHGGYFIIVIK